jgi:hypothetical protein
VKKLPGTFIQPLSPTSRFKARVDSNKLVVDAGNFFERLDSRAKRIKVIDSYGTVRTTKIRLSR